MKLVICHNLLHWRNLGAIFTSLALCVVYLLASWFSLLCCDFTPTEGWGVWDGGVHYLLLGVHHILWHQGKTMKWLLQRFHSKDTLKFVLKNSPKSHSKQHVKDFTTHKIDWKEGLADFTKKNIENSALKILPQRNWKKCFKDFITKIL